MDSLILKNINKSFGQGTSTVLALKQINFTAKKGELTLILGPSGSGKSTLLTILGGIQTPTSGQVFINQVQIDQLTKKQLEKLRLKQIGFILQAYNLVPYLKVKEQFTLVDQVKKQNLTPDHFDALLAQLGIVELLEKYPNELSGGQAQRVAIARALYPNPDIILADEPTAALDSERVAIVGQLLSDLAHEQDKAIVTVTHDERLIDFADHIFQLIDGQLTQVK